VLPEAEERWSARERAEAADAPAPVRELLAARPGAPVFRYRGGIEHLRRYYVDRPPQDLGIVGGTRGTAVGALPHYLLLVGSPAALPWVLQYALNYVAFTGRLDLDEGGLARYVGALLTDWGGAAADPARPVVWAVDHGPDDITHLMREAVAVPVLDALAADAGVDAAADPARGGLLGPAATAEGLAGALRARRPALVVTSSHGMTGPLDDPPAMQAQLGLPVAEGHAVVRPEALLGSDGAPGWRPDGAVWYAHACCGAGAESPSRFSALFAAGSSARRVLDGVAALGAQTAPLPRALLGAEAPLRAFVAHVEPTFDWTLFDARNRQRLTDALVRALYEGLGRGEPVGLVFRPWYDAIGALRAQADEAAAQLNAAVGAAARRTPEARLLRARLTALDRQSLVVLGDPTVCLPPIGAAPGPATPVAAGGG
jgi:hypothetical protein